MSKPKPAVSDKEMLAYLRFRTPEENQVGIFFLVLIIIDFLGFFPYMIGPFSRQFFIAALVPAIFLNLWMIVYVFAPYKLEKAYYLLVGVFSIVSAYLYWLGSEKIIYINLGVEGYAAFIVGLFILILLITFFYFYTRYQSRKGKYTRSKQNRQHRSGFGILVTVVFILGASQLGNIINTTKVMDMYVSIGTLCLLSFFMLIMIGSFHQYRFIHNHLPTVRKLYPDFGKRKNDRKVYYHYSLAVIKEDELTEEEMKTMTDEIGEFISFLPVKKVAADGFDQDGLLNVFPGGDCGPLRIAVMRVNQERLDEDIKKMVRTKRWKYFFKGIPEEEYEKVEDVVHFDPKEAVLQSGDLSEVRAFLQKKMR